MRGKSSMSQYIGSNFDDFLAEEGVLAETEAIAWKRVIAFQIAQLMAEQNLSKTAMAEQMQTSRAAVDRLLDEKNGAATLQTLEKAAIVLGKRLRIELV
jgi:antitoxin HicB